MNPLKRLRLEACRHNLDEKAMYAGMKSYTWRELLAEADAGTEFGREFLDSVAKVEKEMSHILQKASVDGQLLDLTIDIKQLPPWKQEIVRDMTGIINNPDATEDERNMSRTTLADLFMLFEMGGERSPCGYSKKIRQREIKWVE